MIGLGLLALLVVWLVFSVLKRIFGIVLVLALAAGGFALWSNPALRDWVVDTVLNLVGVR